MSFTLRSTPRAHVDIRDARDWYNAQSDGLGDQLGVELDALLSRIAGQPLICREIYTKLRRGVLRRFP